MKIEKEIPIPGKKTGTENQKANRHVFHDMEIGDSVLVEGANQYSSSVCAFRVLSKRHGKKIVSRTVSGGVRIWRTE